MLKELGGWGALQEVVVPGRILRQQVVCQQSSTHGGLGGEDRCVLRGGPGSGCDGRCWGMAASSVPHYSRNARGDQAYFVSWFWRLQLEARGPTWFGLQWGCCVAWSMLFPHMGLCGGETRSQAALGPQAPADLRPPQTFPKVSSLQGSAILRSVVELVGL